MIILDICVVRNEKEWVKILFGKNRCRTAEEGRFMGNSNDWIHDLLSRLTTDTAESELRDIIERYRREHDSEFDRLILGDVDILFAML